MITSTVSSTVHVWGSYCCQWLPIWCVFICYNFFDHQWAANTHRLVIISMVGSHLFIDICLSPGTLTIHREFTFPQAVTVSWYSPSAPMHLSILLWLQIEVLVDSTAASVLMIHPDSLTFQPDETDKNITLTLRQGQVCYSKEQTRK